MRTSSRDQKTNFRPLIYSREFYQPCKSGEDRRSDSDVEIIGRIESLKIKERIRINSVIYNALCSVFVAVAKIELESCCMDVCLVK